MPDETVWPLAPHTRVKHDIYDRYLDAWLPIILQSWGSGTYAEGYAGPGVYTRGEPGSPIRAIRRLRELHRARPELAGKPMRFVFVEKRSDRARELLDQLRSELADPMPDGYYRDAGVEVSVTPGACEKTLPDALTRAHAWRAPVLAVLDSFGGGSTQALLHRFAAHQGGEVLVTVEPQHFVRNLDPGRAAEVFGSRDWEAVEKLPAGQKRQFIATQLREAMHAAGFAYVISFGLDDGHGGELLLQFGSNHPKGLEKFKDSLWRADPIHGAQFRDPNDPAQGLLALADTTDPELGPLRRLLLAHLRDQPGRTATVDGLRAFTFQGTIFKKSHTAPALEGLRQRGQIDTDPGQPTIKPSTRATVRVTAHEEQFDLFAPPAANE